MLIRDRRLMGALSLMYNVITLLASIFTFNLCQAIFDAVRFAVKCYSGVRFFH